DDLNGLDVARKLIVLARTAGYDIGMKNFQVEPFIPQEYFSDESISDFLGRSTELDKYFEEKIAIARKNGESLRYVARMDVIKEVPKIEVSLKEVPKESELGILKGRTNKIVIISETYPKDSPYIITAPGAGLPVTARNVRRDLLHLLNERRNAH
ncbi:MAG: bifunctional aspartate kinase/homoserine dehydrogenase I, partial [Nanoarchaeota archaeon]|nr:bifunctional aspartate kinase/homoserine dehydrogenase I [Nanoarchaeota archaeon]